MRKRTTKRGTTKRGRRTIKTRRRTIKTRRRTIKRRPRKIMVGGEETEEERLIRKKAEADKIVNETHEEETKRKNLDIDRKNEGEEIIENLLNKIKSNSGNIKNLLDEEYYNIYMINACTERIVNRYKYKNKNNSLSFINEFIGNETIKRAYPHVYLSYKNTKDGREHFIEKDELPFIWPWDWDDYIKSYADFIDSLEYNNALTAYNH